MLGAHIALFLCFGRSDSIQDRAPNDPICFAMPSGATALPSTDVAKLKLDWKSKEPIKFESGNYGIYSNGCYLLISKDLPLLKGLRDRFQLTKKILQLAADGRSKLAETQISGNELTTEDCETLSGYIDRWTGLKFSAEEISRQKPLLMTFSNTMTFSSGGESITTYPSYQFPSFEAQHYAENNALKPGLLVEPSAERHKDNVTRHQYGFVIGTEVPEGGMTVRLHNSMVQRQDLGGIQKNLIDTIDRIYQNDLRAYRAEIVKLSAPIRQLQPYLFADFDLPNSSDQSGSEAKSDLISQLQMHGYTRSEAESKAVKMSMVGRDFQIVFQTRLHVFGHDPNRYAVSIGIWP